MALSWTMDKVGPICRTVEDCALVLNAIYGPDGKDASVIGEPFRYTPDIDLGRLTVGYVKQEFDSAQVNRRNDSTSLATLRAMGVKLVPIDLPAYPIEDLAIILNAEAAAAFDDLTRSGKDDLLVRQIKNAWPNVFRASRFIPAVEYLQANRVRTLVIEKMDSLMRRIDLFVAPSEEGNSSLLTNLTGHPCVAIPNGMNDKGSPTSITFIGRLFQEGELLAFARKYQERTGFHLRRPPGFE
jgi:Asp-tRNA(Asn)/Glu-tRNA(Gln) amidotransferase A subunit family amidase